MRFPEHSRIPDQPLCHTYSIAARDTRTGQLGIAVLSHYFCVGGLVAWAAAADPARNVRQVAMVDNHGHAAAHTGSSTIPEAGHIVGDGFSVQANMMLRNSVWDAMAGAFCSTRGELVDRLLAALDAAEAEG